LTQKGAYVNGFPPEKYNGTEMTKFQKTFLGILSLIAIAFVVTVLYIGAQAYLDWTRKPLGPALDYPTPWELPATWTAEPGSPLTTITYAPTLSFETETPASPFLPCTNLPTMTILAIGVDARSDEYRYGRADLIRAVRVDFRAQRVTMLSFPRDLWVKIPEIKDDIGTDHQKLNTAYTYGNPGLHFWDHPSQGPGLLARTLDMNFDLKADQYVAANMNVFVDIVDALGGLDIYLPDGLDGRTSSDRSQRLVFPAGEQHLTGEQALTLARIRNVSIFQRARHQNLVMCALEEKLKSPEAITKIPGIISSFQGNIQTDLTPTQLSQLACLGTTMPRSNIVFTSFPRELLRPTTVKDPVLDLDVFVWGSDFDELRDYVSRFEAGTWPDTSSPSGTMDPETSGCE
jgi:LCP family protein required for cell wall assembly